MAFALFAVGEENLLSRSEVIERRVDSSNAGLKDANLFLVPLFKGSIVVKWKFACSKPASSEFKPYSNIGGRKLQRVEDALNLVNRISR